DLVGLRIELSFPFGFGFLDLVHANLVDILALTRARSSQRPVASLRAHTQAPLCAHDRPTSSSPRGSSRQDRACRPCGLELSPPARGSPARAVSPVASPDRRRAIRPAARNRL